MAVSLALRSVANDRYSLWKLGITHVVNAAHGRMFCQGSHDFYGPSVDYYGVPADDSPTFDLSGYFFLAADYIQKVLDADGGKSCCLNVRFLHKSIMSMRNTPHTVKTCFAFTAFPSSSSASSSFSARVLVHCAVGVSRSASLVLAYLMIHHRYTLLEAINKVKEHRWIFPNRGFLRQLRALEVKLHKTSAHKWTRASVFLQINKALSTCQWREMLVFWL